MPKKIQSVHILIPRTFQYITLLGKRAFVDVIKVKYLEMGRLMWITQVDPIWVLKSRESFSAVMRESKNKSKSQNERGERGNVLTRWRVRETRWNTERFEAWEILIVLPTHPVISTTLFLTLLLLCFSHLNLHHLLSACHSGTKPVLTHNVFSAFTFLHSLLLYYIVHLIQILKLAGLRLSLHS